MMLPLNELIDNYILADKADNVKLIAEGINIKNYTLINFLEYLKKYLINNDVQERLRALKMINLILLEIINSIDETECLHLYRFFCHRLKDELVIIPHVLSTLYLMLNSFSLTKEMVSIFLVLLLNDEEHARKHTEVVLVFDNQSLKQADRFLMYKIFHTILKKSPASWYNPVDPKPSYFEAIKFLPIYIAIIVGEKDPRNLILVFKTSIFVLENFTNLDNVIEEIFEITACYFPIDYKSHQPMRELYSLVSDKGLNFFDVDHVEKDFVTSDMLCISLGNCLNSRPEFIEYLLPLVIEKSQSLLPIAQKESYILLTKLLQKCSTSTEEGKIFANAFNSYCRENPDLLEEFQRLVFGAENQFDDHYWPNMAGKNDLVINLPNNDTLEIKDAGINEKTTLEICASNLMNALFSYHFFGKDSEFLIPINDYDNLFKEKFINPFLSACIYQLHKRLNERLSLFQKTDTYESIQDLNISNLDFLSKKFIKNVNEFDNDIIYYENDDNMITSGISRLTKKITNNNNANTSITGILKLLIATDFSYSEVSLDLVFPVQELAYIDSNKRNSIIIIILENLAQALYLTSFYIVTDREHINDNTFVCHLKDDCERISEVLEMFANKFTDSSNINPNQLPYKDKLISFTKNIFEQLDKWLNIILVNEADIKISSISILFFLQIGMRLTNILLVIRQRYYRYITNQLVDMDSFFIKILSSINHVLENLSESSLNVKFKLTLHRLLILCISNQYQLTYDFFSNLLQEQFAAKSSYIALNYDNYLLVESLAILANPFIDMNSSGNKLTIIPNIERLIRCLLNQLTENSSSQNIALILLFHIFDRWKTELNNKKNTETISAGTFLNHLIFSTFNQEHFEIILNHYISVVDKDCKNFNNSVIKNTSTNNAAAPADLIMENKSIENLQQGIHLKIIKSINDIIVHVNPQTIIKSFENPFIDPTIIHEYSKNIRKFIQIVKSYIVILNGYTQKMTILLNDFGQVNNRKQFLDTYHEILPYLFIYLNLTENTTMFYNLLYQEKNLENLAFLINFINCLSDMLYAFLANVTAEFSNYKLYILSYKCLSSTINNLMMTSLKESCDNMLIIVTPLIESILARIHKSITNLATALPCSCHVIDYKNSHINNYTILKLDHIDNMKLINEHIFYLYGNIIKSCLTVRIKEPFHYATLYDTIMENLMTFLKCPVHSIYISNYTLPALFDTNDEKVLRHSYCLALSLMIQDLPLQIILSEMTKFFPILVETLNNKSGNMSNHLILLRIILKIITHWPNSIPSNYLSNLIDLCCYPEIQQNHINMETKIIRIKILSATIQHFEPSIISPYKAQILTFLKTKLDDPKRLIRKETSKATSSCYLLEINKRPN
ncbi:uncharacterized protein LOC135926198 isoform X2 [Gordionus sp. m RMFG-2023]|uniref:uncharacterized protein LOC135926198 isoform X2 n=1 Tax=Gordionus sp. m RMFG-2023 TaxID=3053472 RepID=UPI0031FD87A3